MTLFRHHTEAGGCPACGASGAACGPPSDTVPVDARMMEVSAVGGLLRKYRYRSTVLKLNGPEAARLGLTEADLVDAPGLSAKDDDPDGAAPQAKAASAPNKSRPAAANKGGRRRKEPEQQPAVAQGPGAAEDQGAAESEGDGTSTADGGDGGSGGGD